MSPRSATLARDFHGAMDGALATVLDRQHGGAVDEWSHRAGIDPGELIDFSASINPLGPPSAARQAFIESFEEISRYPAPYGAKLKHALAAHHGIDPAEVLIGNGSTQLIYILCAALRPRTALVVGPAFSEYANALSLVGAEIRHLAFTAEENFQFSRERFMAAWEKDWDVIFLATPNSFTGRLIPKPMLKALAHAALASQRLVVVDEAFIDFVESESIKTMVRQNPYLLVLRSLTKFYALPGLRLGYLLGAAPRVAEIAAHQEPWSVNGPALNVARACLEDRPFAEKTCRWLTAERAFLFKELTAIDKFHPIPSDANFLLVEIEGHGAAAHLQSFLLRNKILIRTCDSHGELGPAYFRVAVRQREDNRRLIAALEQWRESQRL
jgi:threonine-phosphate decarboxylase